MKRIDGLRLITNDALKVVYYDDKSRRIFTQTKRTSKITEKNFPELSMKELKTAYKNGSVAAVKYIRSKTNFSIKTSFDLLKELRGDYSTR